MADLKKKKQDPSDWLEATHFGVLCVLEAKEVGKGRNLLSSNVICCPLYSHHNKPCRWNAPHVQMPWHFQSKLRLLLLHHFSRVQLCATQRRQPTRLPGPWDSPGKKTGVGGHFLLQRMKVKSESEVAQSCPTLSNPWTAAYQTPPSIGFFQARVLQCGAIAFSKIYLSIYHQSFITHWFTLNRFSDFHSFSFFFS